MFEGNALKTMLFMYVCIESFIEKKNGCINKNKSKLFIIKLGCYKFRIV